MTRNSILNRRNTKLKLIVTAIIVLVIIFSYFYYSKLRVAVMAAKLYTNDCHMTFEYHVDFNTEDEDEEEGFIKSLGGGTSGFIIMDKAEKRMSGSCYTDESDFPYFSFYKDEEDVYFNIKTVLMFIMDMADKKKDTMLYQTTLQMEDIYLTAGQIKDFFDIEIHEVEVDDSKGEGKSSSKGWLKKALSYKRCDIPSDVHTSVDVTKMDFYSIDMENDEQQVVFGIQKGVFNKDNLVYISIVNKTMRLEINGSFMPKKDIIIEEPARSVDNERLNALKKKYKLFKQMMTFIKRKNVTIHS